MCLFVNYNKNVISRFIIQDNKFFPFNDHFIYLDSNKNVNDV